MPTVIVDTIAGATSNSYLTVAAADAFAALDLGRAARAWAAATIEERERALIRATSEIDALVGGINLRYDSLQALAFPRAGLDLDPVTGNPILPTVLQRAVYLQAAYVLHNADLLDDAASRRARGMTNFVNPDGTGGAIAERDFGRLDARVEAMIADLSGPAVVGWIVTD